MAIFDNAAILLKPNAQLLKLASVVSHALMDNLVIFVLIRYIKAIRIKKKAFIISMLLTR